MRVDEEGTSVAAVSSANGTASRDKGKNRATVEDEEEEQGGAMDEAEREERRRERRRLEKERRNAMRSRPELSGIDAR